MKEATMRRLVMVCAAAAAAVTAGPFPGCGRKTGTAEKKARPAEKGAVPAQANGGKPVEAKARPGPGGRRRLRGPFGRPVITVRRTAAGFEVQTVLKRLGKGAVPTGKIPFTAEPYTLTARPTGDRVDERNVLGTGLAMDLDGDGKAAGRLKASCNPDGSAVVAGTRIEPTDMPEAVYRNDKGQPRVVRIGQKGAHLILYTPCRGRNLITVGISPASTPLPILEVESPALQFLVSEEAAGPSAADRIKIVDLNLNGKPIRNVQFFSSRLHEYTFGKPGWEVYHWFMLALSADAAEQRVKFTVQGLNPKSRSMVVLVLNLSGGKDTRLRSIVGVQKLGGQ